MRWAATLGVLLLAATSSAAQPAAPPDMTLKGVAAPAEPPSIPLYPNGPGSAGSERWARIMGDLVVRNVTRPTLTPFLPDPAKATGAAVIVAPGGGFMMLAMDIEGWPAARWLADHGVAAFVLKYRLTPTPPEEADFMKSAGARLGAALTSPDHRPPPAPPTNPDAVADGLAAVRLVRAHAAEWGIDPHRVGMIGFSAGAMTTLQVALTTDVASRPDFAASIYGPMAAVSPPADAPPLFVALAADDPLFGGSGFGVVESWQAARRPVELHYYEKGSHGFGMKTLHDTSDLWTQEYLAWLAARGLLAGPRP